MIAASALDPDWPEQVSAAGDVLVIIEGLTMYLTQDEMAALMDLIATRLLGATVLIEVMPHFFQKYGRERSVVATGARFTYGCSGAEEFCSTVAPDWRALHDVTFGETIARLRPWLAPIMRLPMVDRLSERVLVLRAPRR